MTRQLSRSNYFTKKLDHCPLLPSVDDSTDPVVKTLIEVGNQSLDQCLGGACSEKASNRGQYNVLSPHKRANLGCLAAEKGASKISKEFTMPETTVRL